MTELTITPRISDKTARFKGTVAAGEHVAVSVAGGGIARTQTLRLRVVGPGGRTLAQFPAKKNDAWGADFTCELNLNTAPMLKAVPPGARIPLLFVLDDYDNKTLYFKDLCEVVHWPRRTGEEEPTNLDDYKDIIADFREDIYGESGFKERVESSERAAIAAAESAAIANNMAELSAAKADSAARRAESGNNALGSYAYNPADGRYYRVEVRVNSRSQKVPVILPAPVDYVPPKEFLVTLNGDEAIGGNKRFTGRVDATDFSVDDFTANGGVKFSAGRDVLVPPEGQRREEWTNPDAFVDYTPNISDIRRLDSCVLALAHSLDGEGNVRRNEIFISTDGMTFSRLGRFAADHENRYGRYCYHPIRHGNKWYIPFTSTFGDGWYETTDFIHCTEHLADFDGISSFFYKYSNMPESGVPNVFVDKNGDAIRPEMIEGDPWLMGRVFFTLVFDDSDTPAAGMYGIFCRKELLNDSGMAWVVGGEGKCRLYCAKYDETEQKFGEPYEFSPLADGEELPESAIDPVLSHFYVEGADKWLLCLQDHTKKAPVIYSSQVGPLSGYRLVKDFYDESAPNREIEGASIIRTYGRYLMYATEVGSPKVLVYSSLDGAEWSEESAVYIDRLMPKMFHYTWTRSFFPIVMSGVDQVNAAAELAGAYGGAGPFARSSLHGRMPPYSQTSVLHPGDAVKISLVPGCTYCLTRPGAVVLGDIDPSMLQVGDVCWLRVDSTNENAKIVIPRTLYNTSHTIPVAEDGSDSDKVYLEWNLVTNDPNADVYENRDIVIGVTTETDRMLIPLRRIRRYDGRDVLFVDVPYVDNVQPWNTVAVADADGNKPNANYFLHTRKWSFRNNEVLRDNEHNFPINGVGGVLEIMRSGVGIVVQRYTTTTSGQLRLFSRLRSGDTWSEWKEL